MIVVFKLIFLLFHVLALAPAGLRWPLLAVLCVLAAAVLLYVKGKRAATARKVALPSFGRRPLPGADPRVTTPR
jgi:hypothetical protein